MTREEAIHHLYTYSSTNGSGQTTDEQHNEAKRMAIKALEKEPTTKNNLAVDKLISDCEKMSFDMEIFNRPLKVVALDAVKNIVKHLSPVTPQEPRWIPVKTINQCYIPELKDYHGKVIATYLIGKHIKPQVTTISISYGRIENKKYTDIVAIMYLPEPYSEVEDGNEL